MQNKKIVYTIIETETGNVYRRCGTAHVAESGDLLVDLELYPPNRKLVLKDAAPLEVQVR